MSKYQIAKTKTFEKVKKKIDNFEGYYRYRIGNYRLFYLIENNKLTIKRSII
ncbi:MAG: type II toxin-antitoxin system RelE/ParE family toxin [Sulfurimonas sp.]|nr:type II toxin-antitoxin system RelE/ParE family toxin [Sulfurimonas sp.]